ncbi:hypothetical protein Tco_1386810 [Tanacetum coccineum]
MFIKSRIYLDDEYVDMESVKKSIVIMTSMDIIKRRKIQAADQNDAHVDDADIRPINNEEPMAEVQTTAEINIFATGQQHTEQPKFNNEGKVDQNAEQWS